jgi:hypothetical protein
MSPEKEFCGREELNRPTASPPGWASTKSVTSYTLLSITNHNESSVLFLATSARVNVLCGMTKQDLGDSLKRDKIMKEEEDEGKTE